MGKILNVLIVLLGVNLFSLFYIHGEGIMGDSKSDAQRLGRLISSYSEPVNNPISLIRSEGKCRFWDKNYCIGAEARRKASGTTYQLVLVVSEQTKANPLFSAFTESRGALNKATLDYISFLEKKPSDEEYVNRSREFEEQVGILVGQIVSYLNDMQQESLNAQANKTEKVLMIQYIILGAMLVLILLLRFRRGGAGYGGA